MTTPTVTTITHLRRKNIPAVLPDEIRLEAGGAGWMGTFAATAAFVVNEILSDGAPITATLAFETYDAARTDYLTVFTGEVEEFTPDHIRFTDGGILAPRTGSLGNLVMVTL